MALNASKIPGGFNRPDPLDPGSYPARVVQIISTGLQEQEFKGEKKPPQQELRITYELLDEFLLDEDNNEMKDKPRWIGESFALYNIHSEKAKSTKRYLALDPEMKYGGDWSQLLGAPCVVTITKDEKKDRSYNNVANLSAMRPKEAEKAPFLVNQPVVFDTEDPDMDVFDSLPEWVQDRIKGNLEFDGSKLKSLLTNSSITEHEEEQEEQEEW